MDSFLLVGKIDKVEENTFISFDISKEENVLTDDQSLAGKPVFQGAVGECLILGKIKQSCAVELLRSAGIKLKGSKRPVSEDGKPEMRA